MAFGHGPGGERQPRCHEMIEILTAELQRIMSVTGCRNLSAVDDRVLVKRDVTRMVNVNQKDGLNVRKIDRILQ